MSTCPAGEGLSVAGSAGADRTCAPCAPGMFSAVDDATQCDECAEGKYQQAAAQQSCDACAPGTFNADTAQAACTDCPKGRYQDVIGQPGCQGCFAGRTTSSTGSTALADCSVEVATSDCEAGSAPNNSSKLFLRTVQRGPLLLEKLRACDPSATENTTSCSYQCEKCSAGRSNPEFGANSEGCKPCTEGQYQPSIGQSSCIPCSAGKFGNSSASPASFAYCVKCAVGSFQAAQGQLECSDCNPGRFGNVTQKTSVADHCSACPAGQFAAAAGTIACVACPAGRFQPIGGQSFCAVQRTCYPGYRVASAMDFNSAGVSDERECEACAAGRYEDGTNVHSANCKACEAGSFADAKGSRNCRQGTTCAAGKYEAAALTVTSDQTCAPCAAGTCGSSENLQNCMTCPTGKYQTFIGQTSCVACAAGKIAGSGAVSSPAHCKACDAGQFQSRDGQTTCDQCAAGFYSASNAPSCTRCGLGTYQEAEGKSFCTSCKPCSNGGVQKGCGGASPGYCSTCSPGTVMKSGGTCEACAPGHYSDVENALSCKPCVPLPGGFQPASGKSFCKQTTVCAAGQLQTVAPTLTSDRTCAVCPEKQFSTTLNSPNCEQCAACDNGIRQRCGGSFEGFCAACAAGTFFNAATQACVACSVGHWCQDGKEFVCGGMNLYCPPGSATPRTVAIGHFSVPEGDSNAERRIGQLVCPVGFMCSRGAKAPCPVGRVCDLSTLARVSNGNGSGVQEVLVTSQERCDDGKFVFNGTCLPCPEMGAQCRDGQLWLEDNYWYNPRHGELPLFWGKVETSTLGGVGEVASIYRCAKGSCVVNKTSNLPSCTEGRHGTLCGVCDEGYFATNMLECKACPSGASGLKTFGMVAGFLLLVRVAFKINAILQRKRPLLYKAMRAKLPEVLKLLTGMSQILGGFATILYRVPWPSAFTAISGVMSIANLDVFALPSIRCTSYGRTFYARFDLHLTSMLGVTALFLALLAYAYSKVNKASDRVPRSLVWNMLLPFLFIIYPSVSKTAILMLRCRTVDGHSYLLSDIALSCETAEYASHRSFAIFGVLVFPVGIVAFFTLLVWYQREKLPPDWWPAEEKTKCKERYDEYRKKHGRSMAKKFPEWKAEVWDEEMAHHIKFYNRFGFLFAAYTKQFWWFESLITIYKLAMTVLILFVSDEDEPKILFGMLGATLMLGIFSFYQPFKNPDLLSINTGAQMVVLLVLFTAQYLIFSDGGNWFVTLLLICFTLTPLVAGVYMTLRQSEMSYVPDASEALEKKMAGFFLKKMGASGSGSGFGSKHRDRDSGGSSGHSSGGSGGTPGEMGVQMTDSRGSVVFNNHNPMHNEWRVAAVEEAGATDDPVPTTVI
jgi:hypothetical protein